MSMKSRTSGLLAAAGGGAFILIALAGQALAHAHLKSATPAADTVLSAAPSDVDLVFTEDLELKFSGVKVTGPDDVAVTTGEAMLVKGKKTLMVPLKGPLKPGSYTVEWHVLSVDGHKTKGRYTFTVKP